MSIETRLDALLRLIEEHRDAHCAGHREKAARDAADLVSSAWRGARERTRGVLEAERGRHAASVAREEANLAIERRLAHQRGLRAALAQAWARLEAALRERWSDAQARRAWIEHHLESAARLIAAEAWTIEHGPDWSEAERGWVSDWLDAHAPCKATFSADAAIGAGFRVRAGHNLFDATLDGLLGDRAQIEGRLLAAMETSET